MDAHIIILDEIGSRLLNLTEANGYRFSLGMKSVVRAKLTPFKNGDLPAANYFPVLDELIEKSGKRETRALNILVEGYTKTRDEPFTDVSAKLGTDIVDALFRSALAPLKADAVSLSLGGLVESIVVTSQTPIIGEGQSPWCGVMLDLLITYNIEVGDFSKIVNY